MNTATQMLLFAATFAQAQQAPRTAEETWVQFDPGTFNLKIESE
jgi:hypothetical protein